MFLDLKTGLNRAQVFFRWTKKVSDPSGQGCGRFVWSESQVAVAGADKTAGTLSESEVGQ